MALKRTKKKDPADIKYACHTCPHNGKRSRACLTCKGAGKVSDNRIGRHRKAEVAADGTIEQQSVSISSMAGTADAYLHANRSREYERPASLSGELYANADNTRTVTRTLPASVEDSFVALLNALADFPRSHFSALLRLLDAFNAPGGSKMTLIDFSVFRAAVNGLHEAEYARQEGISRQLASTRWKAFFARFPIFQVMINGKFGRKAQQTPADEPEPKAQPKARKPAFVQGELLNVQAHGQPTEA